MRRTAVMMLCLLMGCGYSSRPVLKSGVDSVYVPVFDNQTFRRELEFPLTEAVKNEILYKTQLKIVPKNKADSILKGDIVEYQERVLTEDTNDNVTETRVFIYINVQWIDQRTGRVIMKRDRLVRPTEFVTAKGETLATANAEAFDDLAELVVQAMEADW
ncbi:MAG: LPS assembly lipoprotein LptE [Planctomycetota bacterium]